MKATLALVFSAFFVVPGMAQSVDAPPPVPTVAAGDAGDLTQFLWKNRLLVIFSDSPGDPRFAEQMGFIEARVAELIDRDVIVLIDTDPAAASTLRLKFRPRGFMLVLIGKDGSVYLRKPSPWNVREISRSIDKMPIRREEMRNR